MKVKIAIGVRYFFSALRKYGSNLLLESNYNVEDLDLTKVPAFYKTVLTVWQDLHSKAPSDAEEYTSEVLWNNRFINILEDKFIMHLGTKRASQQSVTSSMRTISF